MRLWHWVSFGRCRGWPIVVIEVPVAQQVDLQRISAAGMLMVVGTIGRGDNDGFTSGITCVSSSSSRVGRWWWRDMGWWWRWTGSKVVVEWRDMTDIRGRGDEHPRGGFGEGREGGEKEGEKRYPVEQDAQAQVLGRVLEPHGVEADMRLL